MDDGLLSNARTLWDYHHLNHGMAGCDIIFVLGSLDLSSMERGIELYREGYAPYIGISGGIGPLTKLVWDRPEAEVYLEKALAEGIPEEKIILEKRARNTGENFDFMKGALADSGFPLKSALVVTKPYMERRAFATGLAKWPDVNLRVTSMNIGMRDYFARIGDPEYVINMMVGDFQRIREYPKRGFQAYQEIPEDAHNAFLYLVERGFTRHLINVDS